MHLSVVTPEGSFFDGEADSVVAPGHDGLLGILNDHAPLVTELGAGVLKAGTTSIFMAGGYLQVVANKVTVLATFACDPATIDKAQAEKELEDALQLPSSTHNEYRLRQAAINKAKGMLACVS